MRSQQHLGQWCLTFPTCGVLILKVLAWNSILSGRGYSAKKVWERTQKLTIISSCTSMLRCYARDGWSFAHLCNIWGCTQEILVKIHIFKLGYYKKKCGYAVPMSSHATTPLLNSNGLETTVLAYCDTLNNRKGFMALFLRTHIFFTGTSLKTHYLGNVVWLPQPLVFCPYE